MGRLTFSGARTGKRVGSNNFSGIQRMEYEMGEQKRIVFPVLEDEEGNKGLVVLAEPYHRIKQGFVKLVSTRGKEYAPYNIRCMHPYSQTDRKVSIHSAERGEMCPFCELATYELRQTYAEMEERYGEDGFKDLTKEEQKAFYKEMDGTHQVEQSYYQKTDEDGNKYNVNMYDMSLLALELEVNTVEKTVKGKKRKVVEVVLDENGLPKYKKILMPMSQNRLDKFKMAADNAFEQGTLNIDDHHYTFIENEGTEYEEEVLVGFIEFAVKFPVKDQKMESGKDMNVMAVPATNTVMSDEFIESITVNGKKLQEEAETSFKNLNPSLRAFTPAEGIAMMADGGEYYEGMKEEFLRDDDAEYTQKIFDTILGSSQNVEHEDVEDEEVNEVEETSKPAKAKQQTKQKTQAKKPQKPSNEAVEVVDEEEDVEDIDDMLDELED